MRILLAKVEVLVILPADYGEDVPRAYALPLVTFLNRPGSEHDLEERVTQRHTLLPVPLVFARKPVPVCKERRPAGCGGYDLVGLRGRWQGFEVHEFAQDRGRQQLSTVMSSIRVMKIAKVTSAPLEASSS